MSPRIAIVLLAAGSGRRVGAEVNKVLLPLDGVPVLAHSLRTALTLENVHRIVVVVRPEDRDDVTAALAPYLGASPGQASQPEVWLVDGGAERHDSEARALHALRPGIQAGEVAVVAIHDAARPLASADLFRSVIGVAAEHGAAVPAVGTGRLSTRDGALAPANLVAVQTPQAFDAPALLAAYDAAAEEGFGGTDTAACLERYSTIAVRAVDGETTNLKVTFAEDLALAGQLLTPASG
ncbi:4-diphosphocytidyl-2C-methyl-D-erythritol kinase [Nocardioides marmoriginsengisoli]|uniref:4-diphosphocytidyl-2C-methyl-D-erythritol kinase n=1 Tax=Nocardioides marmoriginsengisoli TaxID=661483 RepID=A0A3N0CRY5_9ACTN|nr:2-C-methyl-D-erythritol 4-phosphate cytidylyltransferase [Nocardioides marmoriginsengisoli]RNL66119.1 4-diphosphocytidyl-2C-methyl-D-erythritol kinase [Nocardioides marmoriginsengisoli]